MPIDFDMASCTAAADESPEMELVASLNAAAEAAQDVQGINLANMSDVEIEDRLVRFRGYMSLKVKDNSRIKKYLGELEAERSSRASNAAIQVNAQQMAKQRLYFDKPYANGSAAASSGIPKENKPSASSFESDEPIRLRAFPRKKKLCTPETRMPSKPSLKGLQSLASTAIPVDKPSKPRRKASVGGSADSAVVLFSSDDECPSTTLVEPPPRLQECRTRRTSLRLSEQRKLEQDMKIAYPSRDDPDAVEVYYRDLQRLKPMEFLNDTVIDFFIKYLQNYEVEKGNRRNHFYFFNSFFFKKLSEVSDAEKQAEAFRKLRKWTKGVDIFEKSYLFVPVNDKFHWSLVIVCFSEDTDGGSLMPFIYHLDSLECGHASKSIFSCLQRYLETEHAHTQCSRHIDWKKLVTKRVEVPRQDNDYDCGLFLLCYIKRFVMKAPLPCKLTEATKMFGRRWFDPVEASKLRTDIRHVLTELFEKTS